jgi:amino acid adenylation domain-containing protein
MVKGWRLAAVQRTWDRLDEMLRAAADEAPDRIALVEGDVSVTYRELIAGAERTAAALHAAGVKPGDTVVVLLEQGIAMVTALVGAVLSGGAHLALDPADPRDRLRYVVGDSGARVIVTTEAIAARLETASLPVATVLADGAVQAAAPADPARPKAGGSPLDPAYLIYTSGSTGSPKGCAIPHQAITSRLSWTHDEIAIAPGDRVLLRAPCGFDIFVAELYLPLTAGATLVIAEAGRQRDAGYLTRAIEQHRVTIVYTVPSLVDMLLTDAGDSGRLDSLRIVFTGGEQLRASLVGRFCQQVPAAFYNMYGPTECTFYCTFWRCPADGEPGQVFIGRPVAETELLVLGADGEAAPGETGELYVGGTGLALGYVNRPQLTERMFGPIGGRTGDTRMYRTGDLVRWSRDGELEFVGRSDDQVKVRGHRVEPGEVEAALLRTGGLAAAAVVPDDSLGSTRLVAFVVPADGASVTAATGARLRHAITAWLPEYLVPAAVEVVAELPLTGNGKTDRRALRELAAARAEDRAPGDQAERTGVARQVAVRWSARLGVPDLSDDDDFFELGGNSIAATQVCRDLGRELGIQVPVGVLFDSPTLRHFISAVTERAAQASAA